MFQFCAIRLHVCRLELTNISAKLTDVICNISNATGYSRCIYVDCNSVVSASLKYTATLLSLSQLNVEQSIVGVYFTIICSYGTW